MDDLNVYYCVTAHYMELELRAKLRNLARFSEPRQSVIERIMHGWSPQQIAGRLAGELDFEDTIAMGRQTIRHSIGAADLA